MTSLENSTKHTKKNLYQSFSNSSKRLKGGDTSQYHSMKALDKDTKPDKDTTKKRKLKANIFYKCRCKNSSQNISKLNPTTHKNNKNSMLKNPF